MIRKTIIVVLTLATCATVIFGFVSYRTVCLVSAGHVDFGFNSGRVILGCSPGSYTLSHFCFQISTPLEPIWLPVAFNVGSGWAVHIPLWIPFLVFAFPTFILWRRGKAPLPNHCKCGYDLTGNLSGICPECGDAIEDK